MILTLTDRWVRVVFVIAALMAPQALLGAETSEGTVVYREKGKCAFCHRIDGTGSPAMKAPDFTDPKWQASISTKTLIDAIKSGKKGSPMPAFVDKLTDREIEAVAAYIRSFDSSKKKR